jgi:voltage-gated potassium channel
MIAFIVIVMSGFLIAAIDPGFDTPWDGVWWAWVTVTTVGYGDFVPLSIEGRLFASFLILMGIGLFSLLTANFSAFIISREEREILRREHRILSKLEDLDTKINRLEKHLSYFAQKQQEKEDRQAQSDKSD